MFLLRFRLAFVAVCLTALAGLAHGELRAAELLVYQGKMIADDGNPILSTKDFTVTVVRDESEQGGTLYWTVAETGLGELPWIQRFGAAQWRAGNGFNLQSSAATLANPLLLHVTEDHTSLIPIALSQITDGNKINQETVWKQGPLSYRVVGRDKQQGISCWRLLGFNNFGTKRTVWVDPVGIIYRLEERVTVGQGERHTLELTLMKKEALSTEARTRAIKAFDAFAALREQLSLKLPVAEVIWNDEQLKQLREQSEPLVTIAQSTPMMQIAAAAKKDLQIQSGRRGGVAALMNRAVGRVVSNPGFELYRGEGYDDANLKGKITILHFWDYKDAPLSPPYGQVGYLDFLSRKYSDKGLAVFGVVARPELDDPTQRSRVRVSARKFASFMNLSYPVVADVRGYLEELGDPRRAGAKLPLFVVLDRNGKIIHYKVGFYEVDRAVGLKELHDLILVQFSE